MISCNDKISVRQFQILMLLNLLGTNIIVLPRKIGVYAYEDSPIAIIIGIIIGSISIYLIVKASSLYPDKEFENMCSNILGSPITKVIVLLFILKIIVTIGLELRIFTEIINDVILSKTPINIIGIVLLIVSGYMASKGIEARARVGEILIILIFIFVVIIAIICFYNTDFTNLLPVLKNDKTDILKGSVVMFLSYSTIEYTFLIYSRVRKSKNIARASIGTVILLGVIALMVTVVSIGRFTATGLNEQLYPVLELMNSINMAGSFIERQEAFIISFWIFMIFASTSAGIYFSSILMKNLFKKGKHYKYVIATMIFCFFVSILPQDIKFAELSVEYIYTILSSFYMILLPILLIIVYKIRKLGDKNEI